MNKEINFVKTLEGKAYFGKHEYLVSGKSGRYFVCIKTNKGKKLHSINTYRTLSEVKDFISMMES